jgi:hypothetical protein
MSLFTVLYDRAEEAIEGTDIEVTEVEETETIEITDPRNGATEPRSETEVLGR